MPTTSGTEAAGSASVLQIQRTFKAARQKVFDAWTRPELLSRWHSPGEEFTINAEVDLRVGGAYRIEMLNDKGDTHTIFGEYEAIEPPEKLVFTWSWESGYVQNSRVTIELSEIPEGTEVSLRHERFPGEEVRDAHGKGWGGTLNRLAKFVEG